jgi:hypothetical protein
MIKYALLEDWDPDSTVQASNILWKFGINIIGISYVPTTSKFWVLNLIFISHSKQIPTLLIS